MNAVRWWQRAAGLLMVLFLLTVGWKMRAFIWTAVQNAVVRQRGQRCNKSGVQS